MQKVEQPQQEGKRYSKEPISRLKVKIEATGRLSLKIIPQNTLRKVHAVKYQQDLRISYEEQKRLVIPEANAVEEPVTMVVHLQYTP